MDFGAYHSGSYSKILKSVLLKGSEKCLEDPFSLMCSPTSPNSTKTELFLIKKTSNQQETHQNPEPFLSSSFFHSNHCHSDLQPPIHQSCHLGRVSHKTISVMTQIFKVNLDLYQCNEL